jgi:CubicO group peptidase (beta-lactamase class C family)
MLAPSSIKGLFVMALRLLKILISTLFAFVLVVALWAATAGRSLLRLATHSVSHSLCTAAFISNLDPDRMYAEEQLPNMPQVGWALRYRVDRQHREVSASMLGLFDARAVYREGLGCLLVDDDPVPEAAGFKPAPITGGFDQAGVVESTDPAIRQALDSAFSEPDPNHPRLTKELVVLHDGKLIAERYAPGYGPQTPIWVHSISKSITNALIGILVRQGKLRVDQAAPINEWQAPSDPRHAITVDQLLRMDSGLPFDEAGGVLTMANRMWFLERNITAFASAAPLEHAPGTIWGYSNISFVLLSRMVRDAAGGTAVDSEQFARHELFEPLGMRNTVIETDITGTPIGSSHVYASARDLASFGQLYLDDGVVDGHRILPQGWVNYSRSQTLKTGYGAGFWTNLVNKGSVPIWDAPWGMPQLPKDMFYARGAFGQYVVIVPSEHLVVVRLGVTLDNSTGMGDVIAKIITALHRQPAQS